MGDFYHRASVVVILAKRVLLLLAVVLRVGAVANGMQRRSRYVFSTDVVGAQACFSCLCSFSCSFSLSSSASSSSCSSSFSFQ